MLDCAAERSGSEREHQGADCDALGSPELKRAHVYNSTSCYTRRRQFT